MISLLNSILQFISKFLSISTPNRWSFFSYFLVPIFIAFYWLTTVETYAPIVKQNKPITIYPLSTEVEKGNIDQSKKGIIFLIDDLQTECVIPMINDHEKVWLSLNKYSIALNRNKISLENNFLKISPNMLGFSNPYAIIVEGEAKGNILFPGVENKITDFYPVPLNNDSLLMWIFIASIFGFGLIIPTFNVTLIRV